MGYYIDLSSISLDKYKAKLESGDLLPSRVLLKEKTDERFSYFKSIGIKNLQGLHQVLKNKKKLAELSKVDFLSGEYLAVLLREINSIHPKSNKIREFVGISAETIAKLEKEGIVDTYCLFDRVKTPESRNEFAEKTGIIDSEVLELTKLTDLSRIKWVGIMFARVLFESGFDTVMKVSEANHEDLYRRITELNKEKGLYKGHIGLHDMKLCVDAAKDVPLEIEY
jgi:hypothetical protein